MKAHWTLSLEIYQPFLSMSPVETAVVYSWPCCVTQTNLTMQIYLIVEMNLAVAD